MGIRIKPRDIEIPKDDPFKHDLLALREPAEVLTRLVVNLDESPCVLAVDAAWGAGKTTFLRMWTQHLRNQEFRVVEINAWETDFSGEPFVALSTELLDGIKSGETKHLKEALKKVLRWVVPTAIRMAASTVPGTSQKLGERTASYVADRLSGHREAQKSVAEFKRVLQDMAAKLFEANGNRPLIVAIDELDRSRPSYAVELLEVAKHLFAVDRIVFVLAVNLDQLAHSVRALYGGDFDAKDSDRYKVANCTQAQPFVCGLVRVPHGKIIFVTLLRDICAGSLTWTSICLSRTAMRLSASSSGLQKSPPTSIRHRRVRSIARCCRNS